MPEQLTKHPEVTLEVLRSAGAKCGEGTQQSILTQCPAERFCKLGIAVEESDKVSEAKVVLHNGMTGSVQADVSAPQIPGFTAKLDQAIIRAAGNVTLVLRYEPGGQKTPRDPVNVQLTVQPLDQVFTIRVNFAPPAPLK